MNKKSFNLLLCLILLITSFSVNAQNKIDYASNKNSHIIIYTDNTKNTADILKSKGFDVLYKSITEKTLELIINQYEYQMLNTMGLKPVILSYGKPFYEIQNEKNHNSFNQIPPGYLSLSEIINVMNSTENAYPSICKVYDLTQHYNLEPSYEGRHIYAIKISDNVLIDEDEPNFLMVSCHHAREIVTPVIALYSIMQFTTNYGIDPEITKIVNDYEIWISPVWNVDGYEYVYNVDNYWRKNRHPYPPGIGVDLNRNYPFGWNSSGSGSTDPTSETYKGPYPASEEETKTMIVFGNDRHFAKVLDYHSYGREVLYGYLSLYHPFQSFLQAEAVQLSIASGYNGAIRVPSANGENYQWHLAYNGSYANLIETHTTFQPSYSSALSEAQLVWPGVKWMLQRPITISGHIVDSITQKPLVAEIKLNGINFANGEYFFSEQRFGRYHLFLPPGTYSIEFSCENYFTQFHEVTVTQTSALVLDVQLERFNENPNKPTIFGPTVGNPGVEYEYTFNATDPDGDKLEYYIKWGDGNNTDWIGPYNSGEKISLCHSWEKKGKYTIFAKVRDMYGEVSESASLQVEIPRNRMTKFNSLFLNLFFLIKNFFKE